MTQSTSIRTSPFDGAAYLKTEASWQELLAEARESGDPAFLKVAEKTVARARAMHGKQDDAG